MQASLPDVKYRSPPLMIHRHRVPLFAFQSFICSFDALAHSCASHPLSCKCSAHPGLSTTITALAVYQAWPCPQVWCCLIHHEEFSLLDSSENYPLIDCVPHANTHQDCHPVINLPQVETILFKYMLSPVFIETIQSSRHASHSLQYQGSWLYAQCYSQ
jgi:hypothetical protein